MAVSQPSSPQRCPQPGEKPASELKPLDDAQARLERARIRRETWRVEPLSHSPRQAAGSLAERLVQLEQLRRIGFALAGTPYPEGPTPKRVRQTWPMERIG